MSTIPGTRTQRTPVDDIEHETDRQNARTVILDADDVRAAVDYTHRIEVALRHAIHRTPDAFLGAVVDGVAKDIGIPLVSIGQNDYARTWPIEDTTEEGGDV